MRPGIFASLLAGALLVAPAVAQGAVQTAEPGSELRVYLMTMGPGEQVWERFGHNAIWIHDRASRPDTAYNYGLFDFGQRDEHVLSVGNRHGGEHLGVVGRPPPRVELRA